MSDGSDSAVLDIWDREEAPPAGATDTILWRSFEMPEHSRSICLPRWVEQRSDRMRGRYLGWLFELGESSIGGRRLIDHLQLRPGLSYWWMTPLAQRFNAAAGSPVHDAIKLLALEEMIAGRAVRRMTVHSSNEALAECLRDFCARKGIAFEWLKAQGTTPRSWRQWTPLWLQALISGVRHIARRRGAAPDASTMAGDAQVAFIDVLVHLDKSSFTSGRFVSNYWTALVERLAQAGVRSNWFHQFFQHEAVPSFAQASALVESFNRQAGGRERHMLLDGCIGRGVIVQAVTDWLKLSRVADRLSDARKLFQPGRSEINLWPLFRQEWNEGLRGPTAMINCITLAMLESALKRAPRQRLGVYIQENQPWEMALIHAWKAAGHGPLIGVPHTTVRYWDLRYFYDPRSYARSGESALPLPDRVAVNGPAARATYVGSGYPSADVVDIEALRYLHLAHRSAATKPAESVLRVLICGDFLPSTSHKMLSWMMHAVAALPGNVRLLFKPHPAYPIALEPYASLSLHLTQAPLGEVLADCDVVFASNITSAAVDAYCRGVAVVQLLDGGTFNMSPLRDMPGVTYVASPAELAPALLGASRAERADSVPYFHLDSDLPRWSKLLEIA